MSDEPTVPHISDSQPPNDPEDSVRSAGAFFSDAQHFVVAGGNFKSITNINHAGSESDSTDYEEIPFGHLDLLHEIRLDAQDHVVRYAGGAQVRRLYSARVQGCKSKMLVMTYQGDTGEEEWREDISRYSWLRHPNFPQLYGTSRSSGLQATIFHDDLIPLGEIMKNACVSPISTVYYWGYLDEEYTDAYDYFNSISGEYLSIVGASSWMRPSTGRLCMILTFSGTNDDDRFSLEYRCIAYVDPFQPHPDSTFIASIPLDRYHTICERRCNFAQWRREFSSVTVGSIILGPNSEDPVTVGYLPVVELKYFWWTVDDGSPNVFFTVKNEPSDAWLRIDSCDIAGIKEISCLFNGTSLPSGWLTQADYVFHQLQIPAYHEDYVLVTGVSYALSISEAVEIKPAGYLFVCPLEDIHCGIASQLVYYWSRDPSDVERLTPEEAEQIGFPRFELEMGVTGRYWDGHIYAGLRQFYEGKGFDPYSQDIARELGLPLLQLAWDPFDVVEDSGSEYTDTSRDSDEEEDHEVGDEMNLCEIPSVRDYDVAKPLQISRFDEVETLPPSMIFQLIMWMQFALILTNILFWLCNSCTQ